MSHPYAAELALAHRLADAARQVSTGYFRQTLAIDSKQDDSPVTRADRETEALIREAIATTFPADGFFGEETGKSLSDAQRQWIIDPIDGTGSYVCGVPLFSTLIALLDEGKPVLGLIDMPALDERWSAVSGETARYGDAPCRTSDCAVLSDARMASTTPLMFSSAELQQLSALEKAVKVRRYGTDGYGYALLASGHLDLVVESDLKPYDYMAHVAIIEAAGGVISDWQGRPLDLNSGPQVLAAANPALHKAALALLQ
ncbi:histidinol-phosphatase [Granulosicoccaceae sp. 1_MG-2023]|nr:histidinol-phosphatase [Granulosicoccaceae sp. 1_MG-2023]